MKRLMIVDDEPLTRYALRKLLSQNFSEHEVVGESDNGIDAVTMALRLAPDVIFMDIKMPGQSGIEASEQIIKKNPAIHIIILTAYDHFDYIQKALEIGVEGYLLKPISKDIVIKKIESILNRIQLIEEKAIELKALEENMKAVVEMTERDFVDLLIQYDYDEEKINKYLNFLGYRLSYGYFMCIGYEEEQQFYNGTIIKERTRNKIELAVNRYLPFMTKYILSSPRGQCVIVFIYDMMATSYNQYNESLIIGKNLIHKIRLVEGMTIKVGIGQSYQQVKDLHLSFSEAFGLMKQLNNGEIQHINDHRQKNDLVLFHYPILGIEEVIEKIRLGTKEEALKLMRHIIHQICDASEDIWLIKEYLIQCYYDVRQLVLQDDEMLNLHKSDFLPAFLRTTSIEEMNNTISLEIQKMVNEVCERNCQTDQSLTGIIYDYVHAHYQQNITLEDVAEKINRTSQYTSKIFKDLFGVNFIDYLTTIRIEQAKVMLKDTQLRVKDIASSVGYEDPNYFCRLFKKKLALTPKEYRKTL